MIRPVRADERSALATLQSYLDAPVPELLASVGTVGSCLVSVDDADRPVGYVLAVGGGDTHLAELVVHPDYRREGRARALLRAVIDRAEPGTRVTLVVAVDNDPARSLYESVGFNTVERRPGFYADDPGASDDAVVYAYEIESD